MKTSTFPSLRVEPELRAAAEDVLQTGESLSSFVEASVRAQIELRRMQVDFIGRGLVARDQARRSGRYVASSDVLQSLESALAAAKRSAR